jgi:hypothetical protein
MYIGIGVGAIFLILMGGAHHIIIAIVALGILYGGYEMSKTGGDQYMLYALLISGVLFVLFVLHGKEEPETGGMDAYGMGGLGLPMGY